jgi:mannose-1-phosphate guanylyltransferase
MHKPKNKIIPIILSGGSGKRLWPISSDSLPKQYISLIEEKTMLQITIERLAGIENISTPIIICNKEHKSLVNNQLKEIGENNAEILLEPIGRNTAPAITAAASYINNKKNDPNIILLVLSTDHMISDISSFHRSIEVATDMAAKDHLIIFGVKPTKPHTGYGYIETNNAINKIKASKVKNFIEKPNKEKAKEYFNKGSYLWNSGMFMFKATTFLEEITKYAKDISLYAQQSVGNITSKNNFIYLDSDSFTSCPSDSIDYALMEKTDKSMVVPLLSEWSDIGSWESLYSIEEKDKDNNVINGNIVVKDSKNSYIKNDGKVIAVIGVKNLIIINSEHGILVAKKDRSEEINTMMEEIKEKLK